MVAKVIIAAGASLFLCGCALNSPAGGSLCAIGPFITDPGATERLTRAEKEYQVSLNTAGVAICGWQPPKRAK